MTDIPASTTKIQTPPQGEGSEPKREKEEKEQNSATAQNGELPASNFVDEYSVPQSGVDRPVAPKLDVNLPIFRDDVEIWVETLRSIQVGEE